MRITFVPFVVFAVSFTVAATPATTDPSANYFKIDMTRPPPPPTPVYVVNFPDTQLVMGTVSVDNLPPVQTVSGTVNVGNLPTVQTVGGNVNVSNLPIDAEGALRVSSATGKFIGVTTTAVLGSAGWRNLNLACNSQFGANYPTVRMCSSKDILKTPVSQWPALPGSAWVHPMIVSAAYQGSYGGFVELSGVIAYSPADLSCGGWAGSVAPPATFIGYGLVLLSSGGFALGDCTNATTLVTCCADTTP